MRKFALAIAAVFILSATLAQGEAAVDTTIYKVVEETPRFPACEALDTTIQVKAQCAQQQLLAFVYKNVMYPLEARQNGNEGTVVAQFVVEKDGAVTQPVIVKDIGGGCGLEVLRVINGMAELGIKWVPGKIKGEAVRTSFTLPVKFRLEEAPPYTLVGRDTVYTQFDVPLSFKGGDEALVQYLREKLDYPEAGNDSCLIGTIDVQLLVKPGGLVGVLNVVDYSDLGLDFYYKAIDAATSTFGRWEPARYQDRPVPASYDLSLYFEPTAAACKTVVQDYQKATELANEGAVLIDQEKTEEGLSRLSEAIDLFPGNAAFLYMRGQVYLDLNRFEEACADLTRARDIALVNWYDTVLPIICR